jgi:hypothetical protein
MKKIKLFLTPGGILFLGLIFLSCSNQGPNEQYVAYVNGEGIATAMFKQYIAKYKAQVYSQFSQKYSVINQSGFWETSFGNNEVPAEFLKRKALDECTIIITQQILAREEGLLEDISYSGFLNKLESTNEQRKQSVTNKKVIYGPVEYTEAAYFDYLLSLVIIELKERLARNEFNITENKLRDFYESHKNELYRRKDSANTSDYYSFDDIKTLVRSNYIDDQYEYVIKKNIANAEIKINDNVFNQVKIE